MNIRNIGNISLKNARVHLTAPFKSNIQNIDLIEANSSELIAFVVDSNFSAKSIGVSLFIPNTKLQQENPKSKVAPLAKW